MKKHFQRRLFLVLILTQLYLIFSSHSGRTDSNGGHHDRKNGGYHFHNTGDDENNAGKIVLWILVGLLVIGFIANSGNKKDK